MEVCLNIYKTSEIGMYSQCTVFRLGAWALALSLCEHTSSFYLVKINKKVEIIKFGLKTV